MKLLLTQVKQLKRRLPDIMKYDAQDLIDR